MFIVFFQNFVFICKFLVVDTPEKKILLNLKPSLGITLFCYSTTTQRGVVRLFYNLNIKSRNLTHFHICKLNKRVHIKVWLPKLLCLVQWTMGRPFTFFVTVQPKTTILNNQTYLAKTCTSCLCVRTDIPGVSKTSPSQFQLECWPSSSWGSNCHCLTLTAFTWGKLKGWEVWKAVLNK